MCQHAVVAQRSIALEANDISQTGDDKLETAYANALNILKRIKWTVTYLAAAFNEHIGFIEQQQQVRNSVFVRL